MTAGHMTASKKRLEYIEHLNIKESSVLADRGYDSSKFIDYIYDRGGEPAIPSRKGAKFQCLCDGAL